ncbi:MAG: hypothetical protein RMJ98_21645 [Myxococcales bacterium]|nr:hypothetical protein [Polyangiaceae bacterium]MDW8251908.1 hypothetical protein [Myxococcales bacterium]
MTSFRFAEVNNHSEPYQTIREALVSIMYHLNPRQLRRRAVPRAGAVLTPTGDNLASVLDGLLSGPDREAVIAMETALRQAIPDLCGFAVRPV